MAESALEIGSRVRIISGLLPGYLATVVDFDHDTGWVEVSVDGRDEPLVVKRELLQVLSE
jgi:transcription antitermination factor NusG